MRQVVPVADLLRHLPEFVVSRRRLGDSGGFQKVAPVIQQPRVGVPGDAVDGAFVGIRLYRGFEEGGAVGLGETVGEVGDPTRGRELSGPHHIAPDYVYLGLTGLKLRPYRIEVLTGIGGHLTKRNFYLAFVIRVEAVYKLLHRPGRVGEERERELRNSAGTTGITSAAPGPEHRRTRDRAAEPDELPAAHYITQRLAYRTANAARNPSVNHWILPHHPS